MFGTMHAHVSFLNDRLMLWDHLSVVVSGQSGKLKGSDTNFSSGYSQRERSLTF